MDQAQPQISVEYTENATVAILTKEKILQEDDIWALESSIMPLVEGTSKINLVINFCNVSFLTSSALGLLIRISKKIYETEGKLNLCSIDPKIFEVFRITRLDKVFDIYNDQEEAVGNFN